MGAACHGGQECHQAQHGRHGCEALWIVLDFDGLCFTFSIANLQICFKGFITAVLVEVMRWCNGTSIGMQPLWKRYLFQSSALKLPKASSTTGNIEEWCLNCGWNHPTTASKQAFNPFCFGFGASHVLDVSEAVCGREPQPRWGRT